MTWNDPPAIDNCSSNITVVCLPPSGSTFPVGTRVVNCTATDGAGNTNGCSFNVTVRDTEPPAIVCPVDLVLAGDGFAFLWAFSIQETAYTMPHDSAPLPYTWVRGVAERIPEYPEFTAFAPRLRLAPVPAR